MMSMKESNNLRRTIFLLGQKIKDLLHMRNTFGDRIIIQDEVLAWAGSAEQVKKGTAKLLFASKGHIVSQGLVELVNLMALGALHGVSDVPSTGWGTGGRIRVGTGTGATTASMTDLVTPNVTNPSSVAGSTSNPTAGVYRISWTATWNTGVLTAVTVTELGLYLVLYLGLQTFGATPVSGPTNLSFFSRLSSSDGDFTAFLVNIAVPLTVEWRLTFTFA